VLEVVGHECGELGAVFCRDVVEAAVDGAAEFGEIVVVATIESVAFDELPQSFNQIQVRGIRRQEQQLDVERRRQARHQYAALIAGVVEDQRDGFCQSQRGDLAQQVAHRFRRHRPGRRDADQFVGHGIPGSQDAVPLTARRTADEQPRRAPQAAQERSLHEVGGVNEEDVAMTGASIRQQRLQFFVEKLRLSGNVLFNGFLRRQRDRRRAAPLQPQTFFKKCRT
jgi:hypothetical protein